MDNPNMSERSHGGLGADVETSLSDQPMRSPRLRAPAGAAAADGDVAIEPTGFEATGTDHHTSKEDEDNDDADESDDDNENEDDEDDEDFLEGEDGDGGTEVDVDELDGRLVEIDGQMYRVLVDEGDISEGEEDEEEYEPEEEEEEEENAEEDEAQERHANLIRMLIGGGREYRGWNMPEGSARLPVTIKPLRGDLAAQINADTSARDVGQSNVRWDILDSTFDSSQLTSQSTIRDRTQQLQQLQKKLPTLHQQQQSPNSSSDQSAKRHCADDRSSPHRRRQQQQDSDYSAGGLAGLFQSATRIITRNASRRAAAAATEDADLVAPAATASSIAAAGDGAVASSSSSSDSSTGFLVCSSAQLLFKRELTLGHQLGFSRSQQRHLMCHRALPLHPQQVRDRMGSRAYIGQYSGSGDFFIAAFQDRRVRLYDTNHNWRLRKDVTTRMTRWTITDTTLSPDQRLLVYASISPVAFVVNVGSSYDVVESQANVTELHEPLAFDGSNAAGAEERRHRARRGRWNDSDDDDEYEDYVGRDFGIWSIAWSPQGGQLIGGTNDNSVYVYDIESKRCLMRLTGHHDEVNAVAYLHGDTNSGNGSSGSNPHVVVSGSDDNMVRVWDLRDKSGSVRAPVGVLVGHTEGLTHICPKGDGYHLISNSKDQTIKLWDVRAAVSPAAAVAAARRKPRIPRWDYRWEEYPAAGYAVKHPDDVSLMTYRGHAVLQTLIRAYFSPVHTTGQRYIYAGSSEGVIKAWDVVSGKPVAEFEHHDSLVRDCSWHPYEPELSSVSWDGTVVSWGPNLPTADQEKQLMQQGRRGDVGRWY